MSGIFNSISKAFSGPSQEEAVTNTGVATNVGEPTAAVENSKPLTTVLTPRTTTINKFRTKNANTNETPTVSRTTAPLSRANNTPSAPLAQSGGRRMRSKSKSLRSSLFLKYKYKMARRSMTMRKGRKGSRKGSRKARR